MAAVLSTMLALLGIVGMGGLSPAFAAPETCSGVWVVVQDDSGSATKCAAAHSDALAATTAAGYAVAGSPFVSQIDGAPANTDWNTNGNVWWALCTATLGADGAISGWDMAAVGALDVHPAEGTVVGWRLGTDGSCPSVAAAPEDHAAASSSGSASESSSAGASGGVSTSSSVSSSSSSSGSGAQPLRTPSSSKAAAFIAHTMPTEDDGVGGMIDAAMAFVANGSCDYKAQLETLRREIGAGAAGYLAGDAARAAKLAILAEALGEDPTNFDGINLIQAITNGTAPDGIVGGYGSAFSQSLAVIALKRAGSAVPSSVVTTLLTFSDASGAFGYDWGGFNADPDSTALAIIALHAVGGQQVALDAAIGWAQTHQASPGYWASYSPVDSTALMVSALHVVGHDNAAALTWLADEQHPDGGFPNSLDADTPSDRTSTASALYAATGATLLTASFRSASCAAPETTTPEESVTSTSATSTANNSTANESTVALPTEKAATETLASTGASDALLALGAVGLGLVALGALALVPRGRMHS